MRIGVSVTAVCMAMLSCEVSGRSADEGAQLPGAHAAAGCEWRIWQGDWLVRDQTDLDALSAYAMVTGDVVIHGTELTRARGPRCLSVIGGSLSVVDNMHLGEVSGFADLTLIGGLHIEDASGLRRAVVGKLTSLGGDLELVRNAALERIELGQLGAVARSVFVLDNPRLTELVLPGLASVGGDVFVLDNASLPACAATALLERLGERGYDGASLVAGSAGDGCVTPAGP